MAQATVKLRKRRAQAARAADRRQIAATPAEKSVLYLTGWQWTCIALLAAAAVLRLSSLSAKVLHHDEGVNGLFMTSLFRQGYYHYDPANYHGPTLYYAGLVTTTFNALFFGKAGLSTFAIRLVTAIFGLGVVWLVLCLRRQLGTFGAIAAAALAATSAGMVFFSRYFIHEILFVFFSLGVVVAWLRFKENGEPKYLMLASASLALLGATKETWIITVTVWLLALLCAAIYMRLRRRPGEEDTPRKQAAAAQEPSQTPEWSPARLWTTAALVFVAIWVLFYSSFFTNFPQGVYDSVRTYGYWFKTGRTDDVHDYFTYFQWLGQAELPALALGFVGVLAALAQARSRFAVFTAFWSMGILAAYSLVPYKTPWLQLSIVLPLILMAGYGLGQMYERRQTARAIAVLVTVVAVAASAYQAIETSFFRYDDESAAYSYAHSKRDLLNLVNEIDMIAAGNAAGKNIGITVMSPEHWPLPWYLRDYTSVGYWGKVISTSEPIVIAHENQQAEVQQLLGNKYRLYSVHDLRPGNRLFLYLRRDVQP